MERFKRKDLKADATFDSDSVEGELSDDNDHESSYTAAL